MNEEKKRRFVLHPNQSALHQLQEYYSEDCVSKSGLGNVAVDTKRIRMTFMQLAWKISLFLLSCFLADVTSTLTLLLYLLDRCELPDVSQFHQRKYSTVRWLVTTVILLKVENINPIIRLAWYRLACICYVSLILYILRSILLNKVSIITRQYPQYLNHAGFESQFCYHRTLFSDNDASTKHLIESKIKLNQHLHQVLRLMSSHKHLRPLLPPLSSIEPSLPDTNVLSRSLVECKRCFHLLFAGTKPLISLTSPDHYFHTLFADYGNIIKSTEDQNSSLFHLIVVCINCLESLSLSFVHFLLLYRELALIHVILSDFLHDVDNVNSSELPKLPCGEETQKSCLKPLVSLKSHELKFRSVFQHLRKEVLKTDLFFRKYHHHIYDSLRYHRKDQKELCEALQSRLDEFSSLGISTVPLLHITLEQMVCSLKELCNALSGEELQLAKLNSVPPVEYRADTDHPPVEESERFPHFPSSILSHETEQEEEQPKNTFPALLQQESYLRVYSAITEPENLGYQRTKTLHTEETRQRLLDRHLLLELRQSVRDRIEKSDISINWRNYRDINDFDEQVIVSNTSNVVASTSRNWSPQLLEIFPALKEEDNGFQSTQLPPTVGVPSTSPSINLTHLNSEILSSLHKFNSTINIQTIYGEDSDAET